MTHWWQTGIIYQIYPRSFMDNNGDGIGDLPGITSRLDYLKWLGIDCIWISPIFPSPQADFGYDVADYEGIHYEYGTLSDFDQLLEEAHNRNIRIVLDLVPNHTSTEHAWFKEARISRDNPKRDWYIWKDPAPDGGPPNNWLAYFGGPAWTFDDNTGQYYMHNFDPGQPELNWRNPDVEKAMFDSIRLWLRRGVDGFRVDVIDRIIKDADFRDNPQNPGWREGDNRVWKYDRVYSEMQPEVHAVIKRMRQVFDEFDNRVMIGEIAYITDELYMTSYYGAQHDEIHLPFNFGLVLLPWKAQEIRAFVDRYDAAVTATNGWPNFVLGNHDQPRLASNLGLAQARIAAMLLLTLRGTPTLYYGDEIGMTNVPIPPEKVVDPQGKNTTGFNRDETRTPMQWDDSVHAGFSANAAVETWLPVADDYKTVNVETQKEHPQSILSLYKQLTVLRQSSTALLEGAYRSVDGVPDSCFVYTRQHGDEKYLIALNFSDQAQELSIQDGSGEIVLSTGLDQPRSIDLNTMELRPNEGLIVKL